MSRSPSPLPSTSSRSLPSLCHVVAHAHTLNGRWYHLRHGEHAFDRSVYSTDDEYFADIAKAYREELADLYDAGCRNVQFDDPILAYFVRPPHSSFRLHLAP